MTVSIQQITVSLLSRLESLNFKKRAGNIFTKELNKGFIGWIGLNHVKLKQGIEINLVVGIRCQEVEQMLSMVLQEAPHKYMPPTISISLGYLMPEQSYRAWMFVEDVSESVVEDLMNAIVCYGVPFMESYADLGKIDALLELPKFGHLDHVIYRRPLTRWLLGDTEGALEICEGYCRSIEPRVDMAAERFRQFARQMASLRK